MPAWSVPAAIGAARAIIVISCLLVLCSKVIVDPQMTTFATFGGFAILTVGGFGGSRADRLRAYTGLAVVGSITLIIGTMVSGSAWLAAIVTIPVGFAVLFAGVIGPTQAIGAAAALFPYLLAATSQGGAGTLGSRLEGWWLASVTGTLAVMLLSPKNPGDSVRAAASALAAEISSCLQAASQGQIPDTAAMKAAEQRLRGAFTSAPYRPTGLATAAQGLAGAVNLLEGGSVQVAEAYDGHVDMSRMSSGEHELLSATARAFGEIERLLAGARDAPASSAFLDGLEQARTASLQRLRDLSDISQDAGRTAAAHAAHAQTIAAIARVCAENALIFADRADPAALADARRHWYGVPPSSTAGDQNDHSPGLARSILGRAITPSRLSGIAGAIGAVARHANVRSVWLANSLRGAVALAVSVAIADVSGLQNGVWVVLGALSVLRTNSSGTGATALRALAGTVAGFAVGAAVLLGIGTGQTTIWIAFVISLAIAAYTPGTAPFAAGQAAFTVWLILVLDLIKPTGWTLGLVRVEDVAIGCAVSLVAGAVFWPRGASSVVGDDLADAFTTGAQYLKQAVDWALRERQTLPDAAAVLTAGQRLDDGLRSFLVEQGAKRASKEDLWTLVSGAQQLRLVAHTLAELRYMRDLDSTTTRVAPQPPEAAGSFQGTPERQRLQEAAAELAGFYARVAGEVGRPGQATPRLLAAPPPTDPVVPRQAARRQAQPPPAPAQARTAHATGPGAWGPHREAYPHVLWVREHLHHLSRNAQQLPGPALEVAQVRRRPWWR
jgi:uncharacterized membrane protein YccC